MHENFLPDYLIGQWVKFHLNKELINGVKAERFVNQFQVGQKLLLVPKCVPLFILWQYVIFIDAHFIIIKSGLFFACKSFMIIDFLEKINIMILFIT